MKKTLAFLGLVALLITTSTFAADKTTKTPDTKPAASSDQQTATLTIEGMHCGGCKKMVTKSVCEDKTLSQAFESCEVTNLDTKKQIGTMVIKYKKEATVDLDGVEKAIHTAGDYKLTKKEINAKITK